MLLLLQRMETEGVALVVVEVTGTGAILAATMRATHSLPTCMLATSTQRYAYAARWPDTHGSYMRMRAVLLLAAAQLCSVFGRCVGMSLASCMVDESGFRSSAPAVLGRSKSV